MTTYGGKSVASDRHQDETSGHFSNLAVAERPPYRHFYDEWQPALHPALFEWYFEKETSRGIARHLQTAKGFPVFLGAPTVAAEARNVASLVDLSALALLRLPRLRSLRRIETVSVERAPYAALSGASQVFFDPPWYVDETLRWLACAVRLVRRSDAIISFVLFPEHVRATAAAEREMVLEVASAFGRVDVSTDALMYRTPGFEHSATTGMAERLDPSWRRGDLVTVRVRPGAVARSVPTTASRSGVALSPCWRTFVVGDVVLAVRRGLETGRIARGLEFLAPVEGTDPRHLLLDTVSARDQRRASIGLWSSGNLVARADHGVEHVLFRLSLLPRRRVREVVRRNAFRSESWRILAQMILEDERP
jgi:hypothetical protein